MVVGCKWDEIYPADGTMLAASVGGYPKVAGRLRRMKCCRVHHVRIRRRRITGIKPSPENLKLYRPVDAQDPEVIALAESIKRHGIQEPPVISADGYILSGHRRHVAVALAPV